MSPPILWKDYDVCNKHQLKHPECPLCPHWPSCTHGHTLISFRAHLKKGTGSETYICTSCGYLTRIDLTQTHKPSHCPICNHRPIRLFRETTFPLIRQELLYPIISNTSDDK